MKNSKKARAVSLRQAITEVLQGPMYLAYCIFWFVSIALSLISIFALPNQNSITITIILIISLISLIIPCALMRLRKNKNSVIIRRFAGLFKVIYVGDWIALGFAALLLIAFVIVFIIGGEIHAGLLQVMNNDKTAIISLIVSVVVLSVELIFAKRFIKALKETASIMEEKPVDTSCFRPAAKAALLTVFAQIIWAVMFILTRGQWTSVLRVVIAFLLWMILRDAADRVEQIA